MCKYKSIITRLTRKLQRQNVISQSKFLIVIIINHHYPTTQSCLHIKFLIKYIQSQTKFNEHTKQFNLHVYFLFSMKYLIFSLKISRQSCISIKIAKRRFSAFHLFSVRNLHLREKITHEESHPFISFLFCLVKWFQKNIKVTIFQTIII